VRKPRRGALAIAGSTGHAAAHTYIEKAHVPSIPRAVLLLCLWMANGGCRATEEGSSTDSSASGCSGQIVTEYDPARDCLTDTVRCMPRPEMVGCLADVTCYVELATGIPYREYNCEGDPAAGWARWDASLANEVARWSACTPIDGG